MTNVSKRKISDTDLARLYDQFNTLVGALDTRSSRVFFDDLFGPEEKIMIVKRLAAVAMFIEGNSSYRVHQLLKVSPSTAESIRRDYESGRYNGIEKLVTKRQSDYVRFWEALEVVLRAGLPPRGRGRWKSVLERI